MSPLHWARLPARESLRWSGWNFLALGLAGLIGLLVAAPLASLIVIAAGDHEVWFHLARYVLPTALTQTALLLGGVAVATTLIGVGTAWTISVLEFPGRRLVAALLPLPLAVPTYIAAYIYVDLLDALGPVQSALRALTGWRSPADYWFPSVRSLGGAIFVFALVLYPYVYLAARAMFETQSAVHGDAARMLGARPWLLLRRITLPLARPAIAVGLALALLETLNDIGASEYLGVQTLTLSVFTTWLNRGNLAGAAQIACVMMLIVAMLIFIERRARRRRSFAVSAQDPQAAPRTALTGGARWLALGVCLTPVALGFLLPVGFLAHEAVRRSLLTGLDPALLRHAATTLVFAAAASAIVLVLGFGIVAALRRFPHPIIIAGASIAGLGYAVPATILALGLLAPLVALDQGISLVTQRLTGTATGLVLIGSGAAVVIAYVARYLAISTGFAQAGFARVSPEYDEVARLLGASPGKVFRAVDLPLLRPAVAGAALLVFVDCLKELPATLLLRPLNVETLATYIYQFASRGSFEEGSLAALIIVTAGTLPVILARRSSRRIFDRARPGGSARYTSGRSQTPA